MRTKRTLLVAAVAALVLVAAQIEVHLDAQFQSVGTAADDDTGSGSEEDGSSND